MVRGGEGKGGGGRGGKGLDYKNNVVVDANNKH